MNNETGCSEMLTDIPVMVGDEWRMYVWYFSVSLALPMFENFIFVSQYLFSTQSHVASIRKSFIRCTLCLILESVSDSKRMSEIGGA
jgi:hypothetical protein